MKTSKRFLGVALALIMIFNVFAVGAFAAGTETAVDLYLAADKAAYAAGDEIVLTVSAQAVPAVGDLRIGGQYAIAYNSAVVEPYSEAVDSLTAHGFEAIQAGYDASISSLADASMTSVDAKNGWDKVIIYNCCDDGATSFDATGKVDLFTIKMKVKADAADGETVIGFNQTSYEDYNAYINDAAMGGIYGYNDDYGYGTAANYGFNNVTITVGEEAPIVYHVKNQIQWADKAANTVNLGVVAGFDVEDIGIEFDEAGTSTNVDKVGAIVKIGDKEDTKYERFVYEKNDGKSYYFRAVIENVPANYNGDIVVTPLVWEKGAEEPIYGDPVTISAADLATLVAKLPA